MTTATAPGKIILFGEHAAVYGQPAIALPLSDKQATVKVEDAADRITLLLPNLATSYVLESEPNSADGDVPLVAALRLAQAAANVAQLPPLTITVDSTIPIAGGMGSGAATAAALIRAVLQHLGISADNQLISSLTYEVERLHHGTPSGIDNTVVSTNQAVWFVKQAPENLIEPIVIGAPFRLLIADTGIRSATKDVVGDVRRQWQANSEYFDSLFGRCGRLARRARVALNAGNLLELGALMTLNHVQLRRMSVSSRELDDLVDNALKAGALGAKLSGAGRGGIMLALVDSEKEETVREALEETGATSIWHSEVAAG
ncbi:MAG: mevalonate kinase [Anaerolineae bacterium]|nr:mevalonate kinase [Anaerolineae bacterium]MCO5190758.1 mevalonate kinase [Anaerolineae bacterium]